MLSTEREAYTMFDKVFDRSNALYVKNVPRKGRGVFANIPFKAGDVIDRAPTWGFDSDTAKLLDRTGILEYYFVRRGPHPNERPLAGYVVFGFSSLMNHASNPNAKRVWNDEDSGSWVTIVATKDVEVDEEITHRYINMSAYPQSIDFID
ncbi:SET domain-containing protein-lysine N-methyltransferase [Bradyrhizobium brasilense]|uniref:SET domain-containing protein-lysine N-methyltransferase n=1 Tax=Bradyrhizobium brasilense TaxID=1419277 RepID=UPI0014567043|nr:SET domain-containing protein-lysine N-methyltransferase [Bradyrhizobium brasilense]NLS75222.1 SET domain-containing protein-lysine N-methyltransferase [Bradyrhizobium brasilense]